MRGVRRSMQILKAALKTLRREGDEEEAGWEIRPHQTVGVRCDGRSRCLWSARVLDERELGSVRFSNKPLSILARV